MKHHYKLGFILIVLFIGMQSFAQQTINKSALLKFSIEKTAEFNAKKAEAVLFARQNNLPLFIENDQIFMELMYIDEFGKPQYYSTENVNSSATISTNLVNSGGGNGLSLDGSGMTIHEWDGGAVRGTHQEYTGRVVMGDGVTTTHYHSTHVAGTMIASGVDANAKGMAPSANLRAFDWNNDEAEMASEAANQNALVSNHSYGYSRGWSDGTWFGTPSISDQEDYLFGFYDSYTQDWDQIAFDAPGYLIVKSAGNDRNDCGDGSYPCDGPYDCIGQHGTAKNILTVGAVNDIPGGYTQPSDVVQSSFSSWGPADDGRIKPDIVTNGVSLYSCDDDNDADYTSLSGTSMAAPSATGSLILLQEHYEDLNGSGNFMLAATLKALVIQTADEAGTADGPDYQNGWGLMNTLSAAQKISENQTLNVIDELTLNNGGTYQRTVTAIGGQPLQVTIVWTDDPGIPVAAALDPSDVMLVNDLDLRITESANTYYPWKLDGNNPTNAATQNSENNVDNVEMVTISNPVGGTDYTIVVDHDGTLSGGSHPFSIVISGITTATPVPPVADFLADNTTPYTGSTVSFTDLSSNGPTSWSWTFSPSTVTYMNSTSATSQNPEVTFNVAGTYDVSLTATNAQGSDSETKTGYIIATTPPAFSLPWTEGFEDIGTTTTFTANTSSIDGLPEWAYEKTGNGRLRFAAGSGFYHSGSYAATIDANPSGTYSVNYLISTLNLSDYSSSTELGLSFSYMHHGEESHANDRVWIRGSNTDSWVQAYDLYANGGSAGSWNNVTGIDIDQILSANGQTPSATFQIRFGQEDNYPATSTTASDGFTFDDITVEEVDASAFIISTFPYSQSWENGIGLWSQSGADNFDWTQNSGGTPSSSTGPLAAHDGTYYMYTEASSPRADGDETYLEATFNFTTLSAPQFSFYYHMFGAAIGSLHLDVFDGNWNNDAFVLNGQQQNAQGDTYSQANVDLSAYAGKNNIIIRFRGIVGNGSASTYYSDIAIDLIEVVEGATPEIPVANFTADITTVNKDGSVQFTDASTGSPTSWSWTFTGGTPSTSTAQNPSVTYNTAGTFTVELTATNAEGSDTETKTAFITVIDPPVADFTANSTTITEGGSVQFTDASTGSPTSWSWTFTGGTPANSATQNPSITYNTAGVYTVELTATNADGSDTKTKTNYITVLEPPVADFTADITTVNKGGSVQFTDASSGSPTSWSWTFAGGTPSTSAAQNPSVTYNTVGTYTVELTATNTAGSDTETKTAFITVIDPPVADFTADNTNINEGDAVQFTDASTGTPTSWSWTFTGGTPATSTAQNPSVTYSTAGTYTVALTATNADGSDTEIKTNYITVTGTSTEVELSFTDFESGWGIWTDGGGDCKMYSRGTYAWSGSNAADIQDNSGVSSSFYMTNGEDVSTPGYVQIQIEFYFKAISMDNSNEDFWVEYFDGSSWNTVADFDYSIDFDNNVFYVATVNIYESDYTFPTDMKIRFMCDASGNRDDIYVDDITITASTQIMSGNSIEQLEGAADGDFFVDADEEEIGLYPNPATDKIHIVSGGEENAEVFIYTISGQLVLRQKLVDNNQEIDINNLNKGLHIVVIKTDDEVYTKKLIVH